MKMGRIVFTSRKYKLLEELVSVASVWRSGGHIVQPQVLFPRDLAIAVGGLDINNHRTMDYDLGAKFSLPARRSAIPTSLRDVPTAPNSKELRHPRQTRSILETAARLTPQAPSLSETRQSELLTSLRNYSEMYDVTTAAGRGVS
jgi:hypothetical protein